MNTYTPHNWYWIVAGDDTQVYASARADEVINKIRQQANDQLTEDSEEN